MAVKPGGISGGAGAIGKAWIANPQLPQKAAPVSMGWPHCGQFMQFLSFLLFEA